MKIIRKIIIRIVGFNTYLFIISRIYIRLISMGFYKNKYPELFYLKSMIKPGNYCLDIGANLGYYSYFMARYAGVTGKVLAVEPIPLFANIWRKNIASTFGNRVSMFPFALGNQNCEVQMGIPVVGGIVHHGMTHILGEGEQNLLKTFTVPMRIPDELFAGIERLDFIKCDVEGFEQHVFKNLMLTIRKFHPAIQTELGGDENRRNVISLLENEGYTAYILKNKMLEPASPEQKHSSPNDFYFIFAKK